LGSSDQFSFYWCLSTSQSKLSFLLGLNIDGGLKSDISWFFWRILSSELWPLHFFKEPHKTMTTKM
jgi:hypothetical protein